MEDKRVNHRSGKFYRKNEQEVMKMLGLEPTPNSGSGWIVKEDGQSEDIICQLKSTDKNSMKIYKLDLDKLNYNASVTKKLPVFAIQFLRSDEVYLLVKPQDLKTVSKYIETGEVETINQFYGIDLSNVEDTATINNNVVKSSKNARDEFIEKYNKKFEKERKSAT